MTTYTTKMTVVRGEDEFEVEVTGDVAPIIPGRYSGPPEDCYPDEGGEVESLSASLDGKPFELTAEEEAKAEGLLQERAAEDRYPRDDGEGV